MFTPSMFCPPMLRAIRLLPLLAVCWLPTNVGADEGANRWEEAIQRFETQDQTRPPAQNGVLFVGSSSIRMWDTDKWFEGQEVINRGFGGSQIADVHHFAGRIVWKYAPRVIVFYAGDNDVAAGKSAKQVADDYGGFLAAVSEKLPRTQILFLPIKPSLKRWEMWPVMREANALIRRMTYTRHNWSYVDTATPMLGDDGKPRAELFSGDGLHLNDKGYELWTRILNPHLARARRAESLELARGVVFHDANKNRRLDDGETTLPDIRVSNGLEIVLTDDQGRYELPVDDDEILFVIKPRGWRSPLSDDKLPLFYYIHKPKGSPPLKFPGVDPTGPLPKSVDFPLYPQDEPDKFQAILFGDPQPRNQQEIDYNVHDVIEELVGTKASFGVTLGDVMFDDLSLFEAQNQAIAILGIPWHNVIGNHDLNFDAANDEQSDETFERVFGPSYYSFDYGAVHFVALDDVQWLVEEEGKAGRYRGGLGAEQMEFIRRDLALIPENQLVVLMMHIPLVDVHDRHDLYRLIERRPFCMSISGHTHHHEHRYIKDKDGWRGAEPHHHLINVTVCGSWWSGAPDERGIPHATMADGNPNGYSIISFDGREYRVDYKAAGRPAEYQMQIHAPQEIAVNELETAFIYANVFNGSEHSKVQMRVNGQEDWLLMEQTRQPDPQFQQMVAAEKAIEGRKWRDLPRPMASPHLWRAKLPRDLATGVHRVEVRAADRHGRINRSTRIIRVVDAAKPTP